MIAVAAAIVYSVCIILPLNIIIHLGGYKNTDLPIPVEVLGRKLVAWKSPITNAWSVMSDECPHRQAPLSQGRIDPLSGCIECRRILFYDL